MIWQKKLTVSIMNFYFQISLRLKRKISPIKKINNQKLLSLSINEKKKLNKKKKYFYYGYM